MASKNLGTVIQRAISDGAFRRQLQSDPAAALRGFNLSPDEIAAVRSGDSCKLMSLGVDQRMSKAFTLSATGSQATRSALSGDISGNTSNTVVGDNTSGAREGIVGDQTSGSRASVDSDNTGGTRETVSDPTLAGTHSTVSSGQQDSFRAVNDPDNTGGTRETVSDAQQDSYRAINDPDNTGSTQASTAAGDSGPGNTSIMADENYSVASRMQDANVGLPGSDVQHDPGFGDTQAAFTPTDSADVQRELLDGLHGSGDALGNTGNTGINS